MEKFIKKWGNFEFQSSSGLTPEFKSFTTAMKKVFKEQALKNGCEILKFEKGHFYIFAFIKKGENIYYISIGDVRFQKGFLNNILFRTAKHDKDYTGGMNCYTSLSKLFSNFK